MPGPVSTDEKRQVVSADMLPLRSDCIKSNTT